MEHLWAPWRKAYLKKQRVADKKHGKSFLEVISKSKNDKKNHVLYRSKTCFVVLNRYPYNLGHLLVAPYRAVANLEDLNDEESRDFWETTRRMTALIRRTLKPHGINIGINIGRAGGAGVPKHIHLHIVPRWEHDINFITIAGGTRIHPDNLNHVYALFKKVLKKSK